MKTRLFLLATAAFLLAFSCAKENKEGKGPEKDGFVTISISAASESTKTSLGEPVEGKRQISWVEGDEIKVVWGSGSSDFAIAQAESDGASTTFTVSVPEGVTTLYAVYPAGAFESFSDGSLSVNVPAVQNGQFASANIAVARSTVEQASFAFKNVCSYILTDITGAGVGRVTVSAEGQALCGKVPVSFSEAGEAVLGTFSETASSVMASGLSVGPCAIAVLPGLDFTSGVNVKFSDAEGTEISQVDLKKEHTLARGEVLSTGALDDATIISYFASPEGSGTKDGSSSENAWGTAELIAWLKTSNPAVPEIKTPDAPFNIYLADGTYNIQALVTVPGKGRDLNIISTSTKAIITSPVDTVETHLLYFDGAGKISISGVTFSGHNRRKTGRGILAFNTPSSGEQEVHLNFCTFSGNSNKNVSGALIINNGGKNYLNDCVFTGNKAGGASAINIDQEATECTITNCIFTNNECIAYSTSQDSGAIKVGNGTVTISACTFQENSISSSNGGGAAVWVDKAVKATFNNNCKFIKNTNTQGRGGAIFITGGDVVFDNCEFTENNSLLGSVAYLGSFAKHTNNGFNVEFKNGCLIKDNTTQGGGAIVLAGDNANNGDNAGSLSLDDCSFSGNISTSGAGGALRIAQAAGKTVTLKRCVFSNNSTRYSGGAIADLQDTNLEIEQCTFIGNSTSSGYGGAIYIAGEDDCQNTVHIYGNSSFSSNSGYNAGGAISVSNAGNALISESEGYKTCRSNIDVEDCSFIGNYSVAHGGAIDVKTSGSVDITGCTFKNNYTTGKSSHAIGGALNIEYGHTDQLYPDLRCLANVSESYFENNYTEFAASTSRDPRGGAIALCASTGGKASYTDLRIDKCYFKDNYANQAGAIRAYTGNVGATTYLNDCSFEGNSALFGQGLCIFAYQMDEFCMNNCSFRDTYRSNGSTAVLYNLGWINLGKNTNTVISNCSLVGQIEQSGNDTGDYSNGCLIRMEYTLANAEFNYINNLIGATKNWCKSIANASGTSSVSTTVLNLYSNKMSAANVTASNSDEFNGTDWLGTTAYFGGLAWAANTTEGQEYKSGWNWNGTLATGTHATMNTRGDVKAKIQVANADFYTWLQSVDGLDKDQRGNARGSADTDAIWPGAFQN